MFRFQAGLRARGSVAGGDDLIRRAYLDDFDFGRELARTVASATAVAVGGGCRAQGLVNLSDVAAETGCVVVVDAAAAKAAVRNELSIYTVDGRA